MADAWLTPGWPAPSRVQAVTTTRTGGVSTGPWATMNPADHVGDVAAAVAANRQRLASQLALPAAPRWLTQVHGTRVVEAGDTEAGVEADTAELDAGLDFELEFDEQDAALETESEAVEETTGAADALGGDLGLDFDPDRDVAEEAEEATADEASADEGLEFDLEDMPLEEEDNVAEADNVLEFEAPTSPDTSATEVTELVTEDSADDVAEAPAEADDFEFEAEGEGDVNATKLDLAEAYVDMGDADGAQDILKEVLDEGTPEQQQKAQAMLDKLAS